MRLPAALSDFEGDWTLRRRIRDRQAGQLIAAEGHARLQRDAAGLVYDEEVTLHIPGQHPMTGTRRYLWRDEPGRVAVHFDDGRYFHALNLGVAQATDHHDCPPDSYDAAYDFSGWPCWSVRWSVAGPRKSYEMDTDYRLR